MKNLIPAIFFLFTTASHAQCNACQDSVGLYQSMMSQTQEYWPAGPLQKDFAFNTSNTPSNSVQCTAPKSDGAGHCVATCSDGSSVITPNAQPKCVGEK